MAGVYFRKCLASFLLVSFLMFTAGCSFNQEEQLKGELTEQIYSFYENLLLKDLDSVMNHFNPASESYYSYYKGFKDTFRDYKNSYEVKEIVFSEVGKKQTSIQTIVTVSGVHNETDEYLSYNITNHFKFVLDDNKEWKINSIDTEFELPY